MPIERILFRKITKSDKIGCIRINAIKFCGVFELTLRGHDEAENSSNPGIFKGLINYTAEIDQQLKTHLEKSTVFKGTSKSIQNEFLQIMLEITQEKITEEIKKQCLLCSDCR